MANVCDIVTDDRRTPDHWVVLVDPEGNELCLLF